MYNIAIIGAGQLGSRHLQGLMKSTLDLNIAVVDPLESSLAVAKQRAGEIPRGKNKINVNYFTVISELQRTIDFCIVATNSDVRLRVLKEVADRSDVKNMLLEKVLFQDLASYDIAQDLLTEKKIKAWVNSGWRNFPFLKEIRNEVRAPSKMTYVVTGGRWGLACNTIHNMDLLSCLSGIQDFTLDISAIEKIIPSKRNGFYEMIGTLICRQSNGSVMLLNSRDIDSIDMNFHITSDDYEWNIDGIRLSAIRTSMVSAEPVVSKPYSYPYQSDTTNIQCHNVLSGNDPDLPSFSFSAKQHKTMITAFTSVFQKFGIPGCPIT
ncbi:Gfo/Idh/MocA family oxidoreductase [Sediminibacterium roseum]|uniref:Gfo/Idh/MocA family oxidoreductase n=1 Tax=Sediminibacterium roseum TaxID=1978412 RepID=A0ABW9ZTG6_9BACT|nr:Gfo/Idh/MocA family oxidoreductase [Sediminibacterium roseum]NCI49047.1 Gfo/Idh/MocA family oxidoreductase [Sediminibacterium roseum]